MVAARHQVSRALKQSQAALYICRSCRNQFSRTGVSIQQQRFASNDDLPVTERVRRKIWGTDNPPGLKDPYGGPSFLEKRRARKQAELKSQQEQASEQSAVQRTTSSRKARIVEETESDDVSETEYVPAETWEGLEFVGSNNWRELPEQPEDEFTAWLTSQSYAATNRTELVSCLHQAIVECLTCNQAGINASTVLYSDFTTFDDNALDAIASANISSLEDGTFSQVTFSSDAQAKEIVEILAAIEETLSSEQQEIVQDVETQSSTPAEFDSVDEETEDVSLEDEFIQDVSDPISRYVVEDESFLSSRLDVNNDLTFTILKRFSQLAGHRIPDPIMTKVVSSGFPLSYLIDQLDQRVVRPKPTKVADILMNKPDLINQSNIMIFPRRETSVDKEKEVGRWKIIEQELKQRGLPVFGKLKV